MQITLTSVAPAMILSETYDGVAATSFDRNQMMYGRVHGMGGSNVYD